MQILIYLYFALVIALSASNNWILFIFILLAGVVVLCCHKRAIEGQTFRIQSIIEPSDPQTPVNRVFVCCFLIVAMGSIAYWLAYYPGGFNLDAYGQWDQAHGIIQYDDWHPIISTLLIQLFSSICDSFAFCIFSQIIVFSLSVALLLSTIYRHGVNIKLLLLVAVYISINPAIGLNTISLTKDVQFTIFVILMTDVLIRIYFTNGSWLTSFIRCAYTAIITAMICFVRHNGILYVLPVFLLIPFYKQCSIRYILITVALSLTCVITIKAPISQYLNVAPHENRIGETMGIPMAIMANALVSEPEKLPDEVHAFLNMIANDTSWKDHYITGEWDSCKWVFGGPFLLVDIAPFRIIEYMITTIRACPNAAYQSFRANTRIVWEPLISFNYWVPNVYIEENDYNIKSTPIKLFSILSEILIKASLLFPIGMFCWNTGSQIIFILIALLLAKGRKAETCAYFYIPLLVYDFGTMLLLAGPNQRYFYCNAVLFFPIILCSFIERGAALCPKEL